MLVLFVDFCLDLIGKPEEKRPIGRYRHRWEDNFILGITEI
jgi:hypothetical protein